MRIVQVAPYYFPHLGGVESYMRSLCRELVRLGHEVMIYTAQHDPRVRLAGRVEGIPVRRFRPVAMPMATPITPALAHRLAGERWDIIHAHTPPPLTSYYAAKAARRSGTPFVLTYHCDPILPSLAGRFAAWVYRWTLGRYTLAAADKVIATTETYAATSRTLWPYDTVVIPNGVDIGRFRPGLDGSAVRRRHSIAPGERVVLFVGRLTHHKGVDYLIRAAGHFPHGCRLLIAGDGPLRPSLAELAHRAKGRVLFAGAVSEEALPSYYAACDVLVLPSVSRLEAFGIVLLEAMASGKPVIATDMPGMREVVDDGVEGYLVRPFDSDDIAKHVRRLLAEPEAAARMGVRGREKVEEKYSWRMLAGRVVEIYQELAARAGTTA